MSGELTGSYNRCRGDGADDSAELRWLPRAAMCLLCQLTQRSRCTLEGLATKNTRKVVSLTTLEVPSWQKSRVPRLEAPIKARTISGECISALSCVGLTWQICRYGQHVSL